MGGLLFIPKIKTMKKVQNLSLLFALAMMLFACGGGTSETTESTDTASEETASEETMTEGPSGEYTLSGEESQLMWEGNMLKIGGVSLYGHAGTLAFQKGKMSMENGQITEGMFVVDMTTITPTDEAYDEENTPDKLVGHLSSPDFFAIEEFPTATFQIKGMEGNSIMGDMTIRGVTHAETIENVEVTVDGDIVMAKGSMTVDRQKYNVAWENPAEDKVLSDDLDLEFNIVAAKGDMM